MSSQTPPRPSPWQEVALVLLRMGIGWHFLYEGLVKLAEPRLDVGGVPGRVPVAAVGLLPLDRGPPGGPAGRGPAERLGPRPDRPRAPARRVLPFRGDRRDRPALPLLRREPPARRALVERGGRGQLPDRQQEPGRDPRPLRRGRVPRGRVLRPRARSRRPVVARAPARGWGHAAGRRAAVRKLAARADPRRGQPARARGVRARRPREAALRQLRGEAPPGSRETWTR